MPRTAPNVNPLLVDPRFSEAALFSHAPQVFDTCDVLFSLATLVEIDRPAGGCPPPRDDLLAGYSFDSSGKFRHLTNSNRFRIHNRRNYAPGALTHLYSSRRCTALVLPPVLAAASIQRQWSRRPWGRRRPGPFRLLILLVDPYVLAWG